MTHFAVHKGGKNIVFVVVGEERDSDDVRQSLSLLATHSWQNKDVES